VFLGCGKSAEAREAVAHRSGHLRHHRTSVGAKKKSFTPSTSDKITLKKTTNVNLTQGETCPPNNNVKNQKRLKKSLSLKRGKVKKIISISRNLQCNH